MNAYFKNQYNHENSFQFCAKVKCKRKQFSPKPTFIARVDSSKTCWSLIPQGFQDMCLLLLLLNPKNHTFFNLINPAKCQQQHHPSS
jgi:hypothetical protein